MGAPSNDGESPTNVRGLSPCARGRQGFPRMFGFEGRAHAILRTPLVSARIFRTSVSSYFESPIFSSEARGLWNEVRGLSTVSAGSSSVAIFNLLAAHCLTRSVAHAAAASPLSSNGAVPCGSGDRGTSSAPPTAKKSTGSEVFKGHGHRGNRVSIPRRLTA